MSIIGQGISVGGGGVSSSEVTATKDLVLLGQTALTSDSLDEIGIGEMPNNGAWTLSINPGSSILIPIGYHDGTGVVSSVSPAVYGTYACQISSAQSPGFTISRAGRYYLYFFGGNMYNLACYANGVCLSTNNWAYQTFTRDLPSGAYVYATGSGAGLGFIGVAAAQIG